MNKKMRIGDFIIMVLATNTDRTEFYSDAFIAPLHITELSKAEEFGQEAAELRWTHVPGLMPENFVVKSIKDAQL